MCSIGFNVDLLKIFPERSLVGRGRESEVVGVISTARTITVDNVLTIPRAEVFITSCFRLKLVRVLRIYRRQISGKAVHWSRVSFIPPLVCAFVLIAHRVSQAFPLFVDFHRIYGMRASNVQQEYCCAGWLHNYLLGRRTVASGGRRLGVVPRLP